MPPSNAASAIPSHMGGSGIGKGLSACSSIYPLVLVDSNLYDFIFLFLLLLVVGCSSIRDFNSVPFKLVNDLGHHQIAVDALVIM